MRVTGGRSRRMLVRHFGFTIIELLIVVVVIGVLASITLVVYTSVVKRTQAAQYLAAQDAWVKFLRVQLVSQGSLPIIDTDPVCLGNSAGNFPANANLPAGRCIQLSSTPPTQADYSQTFIDQLGGKPPAGSLPEVNFSAGSIDGSARGLAVNIYYAAPVYQIVFYYYMPFSGNCGQGTETATVGIVGACQSSVNLVP